MYWNSSHTLSPWIFIITLWGGCWHDSPFTDEGETEAQRLNATADKTALGTHAVCFQSMPIITTGLHFVLMFLRAVLTGGGLKHIKLTRASNIPGTFLPKCARHYTTVMARATHAPVASAAAQDSKIPFYPQTLCLRWKMGSTFLSVGFHLANPWFVCSDLFLLTCDFITRSLFFILLLLQPVLQPLLKHFKVLCCSGWSGLPLQVSQTRELTQHKFIVSES